MCTILLRMLIRFRRKYWLLLLILLVGVASFLFQTSILQRTAHAFYSLTSLVFAQHPAPIDSREENTHIWMEPLEQQNGKMILMKSFPYWYEIKPGAHVLDSCDHPCIITQHDDQASRADCIVFFSHYYRNDQPPARRPEQIWVYFAVESPLHSDSDVFAGQAWQRQFNWTMTYRRDSQFYFGYGTLLPAVQLTENSSINSMVSGKTKMAAWFVSNCQTPSKRAAYVEALQRFISVDIYGKCGPLKCGSTGNATCLQMLSKEYYFYLAFENSFCDDYITEKAFEILLKADIIPVVRGGGNYSAILPPHSFIDVADFPSVEDLAAHLKMLASDKTAYLQYFAWRSHWKVIAPMPIPLCDLCKHLHNPHALMHVYHDVDVWWKKDRCHNAPELKVNH